MKTIPITTYEPTCIVLQIGNVTLLFYLFYFYLRVYQVIFVLISNSPPPPPPPPPPWNSLLSSMSQSQLWRTHDAIKTSLLRQATSRRRFDAIMTLLLCRVPVGMMKQFNRRWEHTSKNSHPTGQLYSEHARTVQQSSCTAYDKVVRMREVPRRGRVPLY